MKHLTKREKEACETIAGLLIELELTQAKAAADYAALDARWALEAFKASRSPRK
jgi:hypothetical protein